MSRTKDCPEIAWWKSVARVQGFFNHVVQEITFPAPPVSIPPPCPSPPPPGGEPSLGP